MDSRSREYPYYVVNLDATGYFQHQIHNTVKSERRLEQLAAAFQLLRRRPTAIEKDEVLSESPIFIFDSQSPVMQQAVENARKQFRYFWREMTWESRRIVKGLGMAAIKAPFSDPPRPPGLLQRCINLFKGGDNSDSDSKTPSAEQMWVSDIEFDGDTIQGILLNQPNWVRSVQEGDPVTIRLDEISDWMYVIDDHVYGGYTVQSIRAEMSPQEREAHDDAWGLIFPDPSTVKLMPDDWDALGVGDEHPMALNMAEKMSEELSEHPEYLQFADDAGWTMLHGMAAGGSVASCRVLLDHGADVNAQTVKGYTPLALADRLGWLSVSELLRERGGR